MRSEQIDKVLAKVYLRISYKYKFNYTILYSELLIMKKLELNVVN